MITFVVLAMSVFTAAILNYQRGPLDPSPSDRDRLEPSYHRENVQENCSENLDWSVLIKGRGKN